MNPFEKILERLEKPQFDIGCGACHNKEKCDEVQENINDEKTDLCAETMRVIAKQIVQEVAEEFATDTNVGTNGWIPCSERLPEDDDTLYLVSYTKIFFDKPFYFMDIAYLYTCKNGTRYWVSAKSDSIRKVSKVSAWQPLPEPYKEENKNEE